MLGLIELFVNLFSLTLIAFIAAFAWRNRDRSSCPQLLAMCVLLFIWDIGAWVQSLVPGGQDKMPWVRFMHIGILYLIPAFIDYILHYTGNMQRPMRILLRLITVFETVTIFTVFTDPWLHWFWKPVAQWKMDRFGMVLLQNTFWGDIVTVVNLMAGALAIMLLLLYYIRARDDMHRQTLCILIASAFFSAFACMRNLLVDYQNVLPPIAFTFFIPALIVLIGILQYDLTSLIPIAYQEIFEEIDEGVIIYSNRGAVLNFNRSAQQILQMHGYGLLKNDRRGLQKVREIVEKNHPDLSNPNVRNDSKEFDTSFPLGGKMCFYHFHMYPFHNRGKTPAGSIIMIRDVTEQHYQTEVLQYQAERDGLTGVYNRQTFTRLVEEKLDQDKGPWSMLYMDLDHFKVINDTYGHVFGDQVLQETCGCIARRMGKDALLCRAGGEEFMVFLSGLSSEQAAAIAEDIRSEIESHRFNHLLAETHVTISVGVVTSVSFSFDRFYQLADKMLYIAKSEGRNCVRVWDEAGEHINVQPGQDMVPEQGLPL